MGVGDQQNGNKKWLCMPEKLDAVTRKIQTFVTTAQ